MVGWMGRVRIVRGRRRRGGGFEKALGDLKGAALREGVEAWLWESIG